jgi:hypothetical protein
MASRCCVVMLVMAAVLSQHRAFAQDSDPGNDQPKEGTGDPAGGSSLATLALQTDYNFVPVTACRILDTRIGTGDFAGLRTAGSTTNIKTDSYSRVLQGGTDSCPGFDTGLLVGNGIWPRGPAAIAYTLTVVDYADNGYVTVFPFSVSRPHASTINFGPGTAPTPLATSSTVGACVPCASEVSLYVKGGSTDLIVDVVGYFDKTFVGSSSGSPLAVASAVVGSNFMFSDAYITPLRTLTCVVTADLTWVNNGTNAAGTGTLSTARYTYDLAAPQPESDSGWANHVGGSGAGRGSASKTAVWTLPPRAIIGHPSGLVAYSFGCNFVASGDFVGDSAYCTVTWSCH